VARRRSLVAAATAALAAPAAGQPPPPYPARPVRLLVPWPPGEATDLVARALAQRLQERWGQPVVVENRPGAGGTVGTDAAAKAAPDGHTILAASTGPFTLVPLVQRTPYDPERDFRPVAMLALLPYLLVVRAESPLRDLAGLLDRLRAEPGRLSYASPGAASAAHLTTLLLLGRAGGLEALHVPFQGSPPALAALLAGQVDFSVATPAAAGPLVRQGALRALGISAAQGSALMPEVPPLASAPDGSLAGFDTGAFSGLAVPAGTPAPPVERIGAEAALAMADPALRDRFAGLGVEPRFLDAARFAAFLRAHREAFRQVIAAHGLRVD
jgi:tripartite-type tricarboxylate transporter receptor subunit TctC